MKHPYELAEEEYEGGKPTCKTHRTYKAIHALRSTKKHPDGCTQCWAQYHWSVRRRLSGLPTT